MILLYILSKDPWLFSLDWDRKDIKMLKKAKALEKKSINFNDKDQDEKHRKEFLHMISVDIDKENNPFYKTATIKLRNKVAIRRKIREHFT